MIKVLLNFISGLFGWAFYVSCVPGVALIWLLPTIFLIINLIRYKRATKNKAKYKKQLLISLIVFIICIILFIGLVIWAILDFDNVYPVM